ncbi:MAG: bifunctional oligoribonuclease/PAP phosphatase NrnA [Lachnospiraceae bacterium]|nr:bifunctional oligoribonuclease/PAP phosphatase NrnA [Lachnospiraceae bacterium]
MLDIIKECEGAGRIGISGHVRPDGDAISSCLALRKYLLNAFPGVIVDVNLEEPIPTIFDGETGYAEIRRDFPDGVSYDVYFALDCNRERLGEAGKYFDAAKKRINIDHHESNKEGVGDENAIDPEISSTCELLYKLFEGRYVDRDVAICLYTGMVTDTGVFQYSCTSPETMRCAAELMQYGFDHSALIQRVFYEKTYLQTQILGRCLMESVRFMEGRCVVSWLDKKTQEFYGVLSKDFEGIVSQLRNIRGVDVSIFMYETANQEYKVSLRSSEKVNVAQIAVRFGGGGHARAAGCNMSGTVYDCVNNLSKYIEKQLKEGSEGETLES